MLSSSSSSLNGFSMKSTAPAFIARTAIGTSPWPVMMMIGILIWFSRKYCCSSSPLMPGMRTSSSRQPARPG